MKPLNLFFAGLTICLLCVGQVFATATYNSSLKAELTFSSLWVDASPVAASGVMGTGQFLANSSAAFPTIDTENYSVYQSVGAAGSAGDTNFVLDGTSGASIWIQTYLTFNFSSTTNLAVTLTYYNSIEEQSTDLNQWNPINNTGEYANSDALFMLNFDNQGFQTPDWSVGDATTFYNLTGEHYLTIYTGAGGEAIAAYPYIPSAVPEPTTILLLGPGLMGLAGLRRKLKK